MKKIKSFEELQNIKDKEKILIVEIGSELCNPCLSLKSRISEWLLHHENIKGVYVSIEDNPEIAGKENIFSSPAIIVYVEGKVTIREAGFFSLEDLLSKVLRYENLIK